MQTATARKRRARPPIAALRDTAPPQRWQHGQEVEPSTAPHIPARVSSGLEALRRANAVGNAEEQAAVRFTADYLVGIEGVRLRVAAVRSGRADAHDVALARVAAVSRHRQVADALGPVLTGWLVSFLVYDMSFVAMAALALVDRREMKGSMVTLLTMLSRVYEQLDDGRPGRSVVLALP